MASLKSKFIEKEIEWQNKDLRTKNKEIGNRPLPKNFIDYAWFCIRTNNVGALMKGYWALSKIYIFVYARYILRCHYCRKKKLNPKKILHLDRAHDDYKSIREGKHHNQ